MTCVHVEPAQRAPSTAPLIARVRERCKKLCSLLTSTETICRTSSCSVSRSSSLVVGRLASSLSIGYFPAARRALVYRKVCIFLKRAISNYVDPACTNVRDPLSTNYCIMAATAIRTASAPSFPSATFIADCLSSIWKHSRCWH